MSTERECRVASHADVAAIEPTSFFARVSEELLRRMRKEQYDTWFREVTLARLTDQEAVYAVPSGFVRDWLTRHYLADLRRATLVAGARSGKPGAAEHARTVRITVEARPIDPDASRRAGVDATLALAEQPPPLTSSEAERRRAGNSSSGGLASGNRSSGNTAPPPPTATDTLPPDSGGDGRRSSGLNSHYTFEAFVLGPCNRLGHAAALAIGENPGRAYNPLFIHGSVGLGKTHLLQAICHAVQRRFNAKRVAYLSCEQFTNQFINSVQSSRLDAFREYFRTVDVLVVDDVQFLANKDRTQDEFFHTFNALYNDHKQVVMSSDCAPFEIPTLEERLVSRFKWGLVTQLESPCFETRYAIVQRKARMRGVELPDEVARCVAETIDTNIRELEGAIVKLLGLAALTERTIDEDLAREAMHGIRAPRSRRVTLDGVMALIAREFSLSPRDIVGKSRVQHISLTRQVGMFLGRTHTDHSFEEIGRFFGNRDHTTVIYAVGKIKKRCAEDQPFLALMDRMSARLLNSPLRD